MKAKEIMITDVIFAQKKSTIKELLLLFAERKLGGVPVLDQNGKLVGMVTDGDVLRFLKPKEAHIYDFFSFFTYIQEEGVTDVIKNNIELPIETIMTKRNLVTLTKEDTIDTIVLHLAKHNFKKIPVVDKDHKVVGIISRGDVIRFITKSLINNTKL